MILPKRRDYPKHISYNGEEYAVRFVRKFKEKLQMGECCPSEKIIRIKIGLSKEETFITFLHELCHMVEFEAPVKIPHPLVYKLSEALAQIFIENF